VSFHVDIDPIVTDPTFLSILVGYVFIVVAIARYGYTNTATEADFLVAGREIGPIIGGATLSASQLSASTFIGAVGIHYMFGIGFIWIWTGLWAGWLFSLVFVAPQLRRFGGMTVPDFIATRYCDDGANGKYARALTASLLVVAQTIFLTAQITAGGLILQALLGLPQTLGMVLMAGIAVGYTVAGGMHASVLTDTLQAIVMVGGIAFGVPMVLYFTGGISGLDSLFLSLDPSFVGQKFAMTDLFGFIAASAFGIVAGPFEITRIYTMQDQKTVRQAIGVSLAFQVVVAVAIAVLGVGMRALFPQLSDPDLAAIVLGFNVLGPVLGALLIAAVFSAILSTIDSVILVSSAGLAHDLYLKLVNPSASEYQRMIAHRIAVVIVGISPLVFVLNRELLGGLITLIVLLQLSILGGMLFIPVVFGLHWKRATTAGGLGAMIAGTTTVILWYTGSEIFSVIPPVLVRAVGDPVIPGVLVSGFTLIAVSLLGDGPSKTAIKPFFNTTGSSQKNPETDPDE
jgi:SSS family transporter